MHHHNHSILGSESSSRKKNPLIAGNNGLAEVSLRAYHKMSQPFQLGQSDPLLALVSQLVNSVESFQDGTANSPPSTHFPETRKNFALLQTDIRRISDDLSDLRKKRQPSSKIHGSDPTDKEDTFDREKSRRDKKEVDEEKNIKEITELDCEDEEELLALTRKKSATSSIKRDRVRRERTEGASPISGEEFEKPFEAHQFPPNEREKSRKEKKNEELDLPKRDRKEKIRKDRKEDVDESDKEDPLTPTLEKESRPLKREKKREDPTGKPGSQKKEEQAILPAEDTLAHSTSKPFKQREKKEDLSTTLPNEDNLRSLKRTYDETSAPLEERDSIPIRSKRTDKKEDTAKETPEEPPSPSTSTQTQSTGRARRDTGTREHPMRDKEETTGKRKSIVALRRLLPDWPREPDPPKIDDPQMSEEEAFQQAWMELENLRQKKISSLGQKDIEKLVIRTRSKLQLEPKSFLTTSGLENEKEDTDKDEKDDKDDKDEKDDKDDKEGEKDSGNAKKKKKKTNKFEIKPSYKGPHISQPVTATDIESLLSSFTSQTQLHYKYAWLLVQDAKAVLDKDPNLMEFNPSPNARVVIVGDLHGQFFDLVTILRKVGLPSKNNIIIFNGDFVDRGPQGAEVLFFLFVLKIIFPQYVCLVRGNHEDKRINQKYNFETEIREKYDGKMFDHITSSFPLLPLGAIVGGQVFVVHGGLPHLEKFIVQEVKDMNRKIELPKPEHCISRQEKILEGLLWSDPTETTNTYEESKRGCGTQWGKNITKEFLQTNGMSLIVRSHQLCNAGQMGLLPIICSWHASKLLVNKQILTDNVKLRAFGHKYNHYKHVITIFSCSYYCGINNNKGAYMIFESDLSHKFFEYTAEINTGTDTEDVLSNQRSSLAKTEALQQIRARIYHKRRKLWEIFVTFDESQSGLITKSQWIKGMTKVLKLPILWAKIYPYLVTPNAEGKINYQEFLDRYRVEYGDESLRVFRSIKKDYVTSIRELGITNLQSAFNNLQPIDGYVSYQQGVSNLKDILSQFSRTHLYDFVRRMDQKKDGQIDFQEFEYTLKTAFNQSVGNEDVPWLLKRLSQISTSIKSSSNLREAFKKFGTKKTHPILTMTFVGWSKFLADHQQAFNETERHKLFSYLSSVHEGLNVITFDDLEAALFGYQFLDSEISSHPLADEIWSRLLFVEDLLRDLFRRLDPDASNKLTLREFTAAIETSNETSTRPLTPEQIAEIIEVVPKTGDNMINYESFLKSFHIVMV